MEKEIIIAVRRNGKTYQILFERHDSQDVWEFANIMLDDDRFIPIRVFSKTLDDGLSYTLNKIDEWAESGQL